MEDLELLPVIFACISQLLDVGAEVEARYLYDHYAVPCLNTALVVVHAFIGTPLKPVDEDAAWEDYKRYLLDH